MKSDLPESIREFCARAQAENNFETVAEIVDRILQSLSENSKGHSQRRNHKQPEM